MNKLYGNLNLPLPPLLDSIYVEKNDIESLNMDLMTGSSLIDIIKAGNNKISQVTGLNAVNETLRALHLNSNELSKTILLQIRQMINLKTLYLGHNLICGKVVFPYLKQIEHVHLPHNAITEIDFASWSKPNSLMFLGLEGNQFTHFPNVSVVSENLRGLNLTSNKIHELDMQQVMDMKVLEYLRIENNYIATISDPCALQNIIAASHQVDIYTCTCMHLFFLFIAQRFFQCMLSNSHG